MLNKPQTITLLFHKRRIKLRVSRRKVQRNPVSNPPQKKENILYYNSVWSFKQFLYTTLCCLSSMYLLYNTILDHLIYNDSFKI